MSRLGLVAHLETMRANGMGIENIQVDDSVGATSAAIRVWEDSNFPYRCGTQLAAQGGGGLPDPPPSAIVQIIAAILGRSSHR